MRKDTLAMPRVQTKKRTTVMESLIKAINGRIESEGISISELARRADVNRPFLSRILGGKTIPTVTMASKIANAVGLRLEVIEE